MAAPTTNITRAPPRSMEPKGLRRVRQTVAIVLASCAGLCPATFALAQTSAVEALLTQIQAGNPESATAHQTTSSAQKNTGKYKDDEFDLLEQRLEDTKGIGAKEKDRLAGLLRDSDTSLQAAASQLKDLQQAREVMRNADALVARLAEAQHQPPHYAPPDSQLNAMSMASLRLLQAKLKDSQNELLAQQARLRAMLANLNVLPDSLFDRLQDLQAQSGNLSGMAALMGASDFSIEQQIENYWAKIRNKTLSERIGYTRDRILTIPAQQRVAAARLSLTSSRLATLQDAIARLDAAHGRKALAIADQLGKEAISLRNSRQTTEQNGRVFAQKNVELSETMRALIALVMQAKARSGTLHDAIASTTAAGDAVDTITSAGHLNAEAKALLLRIERQLPSLQEVRSERRDVESRLSDIKIQRAIWMEQYREFGNNEVLPAVAERPDDFTGSPTGLRLILLEQLLDVGEQAIQTLSNNRILIQNLENRTYSIQQELDERLAWTPTQSPLSDDWFASLANGTRSIVSPSNWRGSIRDIGKALASHGWIMLLALAAALLLVRNISAIDAVRRRIDERIDNVRTDTIWVTPASIALAVLKAAPVPLVAVTLGLVLAHGAPPGSRVSALGSATWIATLFQFFLSIFWKMASGGSIFDLHFRSSKGVRDYVVRNMRWLTRFQSLMIFLFVYATNSFNADIEQSVGLIAFTLISLSLAISFHSFFHVSNRIHQDSTASRPPGFLFTLVSAIVPAIPLLIGLFAFFGYFRAATQLQFSLVMSGAVLLGSVMVHGVLRRAVGVVQQRAAFRMLPEDERSTFVSPKVFEIERGSDQLLNILVALLVTLALAVVWRQTFPAIGMLDGIVLWSTTSQVKGELIEQNVTAWNLLVVVFVVLSALLTMRSVGKLVTARIGKTDQPDNGTRYAAFSLANYFIIGGVIIFVLSYLGASWDDLQWVIAALGVGLGFGLQEIMANFISGIIILFERPVRVGDMVTIGQVTGTVADIKIRATTIRDFDNREVVLPNKSIITENVTNWTLNDQVTRQVIPIGIAYGSDIEEVSRILLNVAENTVGVIPSPAPRVQFVEHGDSALKFEIRIHIDKPNNRLDVLHRINSGINVALNQAGIGIPFPQRDVHIISAPATPAIDHPK